VGHIYVTLLLLLLVMAGVLVEHEVDFQLAVLEVLAVRLGTLVQAVMVNLVIAAALLPLVLAAAQQGLRGL
jgi:hypothetical protein